MITDPVAELRGLRPQRDVTWAAGPQGRYILARSRELAADRSGTSPTRSSRRVAVGVAVGALALAGAGVAGVAALRPSAAPTTHPDEVGCYDTLSATPDAITVWNNPVQTAAAGIDICRSHWVSQFGVASPALLVACLVPTSGAPAVVPGVEGLSAAETCARIGAQAESS